MYISDEEDLSDEAVEARHEGVLKNMRYLTIYHYHHCYYYHNYKDYYHYYYHHYNHHHHHYNHYHHHHHHHHRDRWALLQRLRLEKKYELLGLPFNWEEGVFYVGQIDEVDYETLFHAVNI
jgi:hypothetical protein